MEKYTVSNVYGIRGETSHRKPETALKARDRREGCGWIVTDDNGNQYDWQGDDKVVIVSTVNPNRRR